MVHYQAHLGTMVSKLVRRAGLRASLAFGARFGGPIVADGLSMDPVMSALVRFARRLDLAGVGRLTDLRDRYARGPDLTGLWPDRSVSVSEIVAGGRPARDYQPSGPVRASMIYFHGGGFIIGGVATHDPLCRRLAARTGLRVVSVEYRLAPEAPYPAAHEDAAAAWRWARERLPGPLLVGGDSAGANLAAGLGLTGEPALQVLLYPVVDMLHQDGLYPSIELFGDGYLLTAEGMRQCADMLIPDGCNAGDPLLSPIRGDLSRASACLIATAGFDPLRDQGRAYAEALRRAGRKVRLIEEERLVHGFADFAGVVPEARRAVDRIAAAIRAEF